MECRYRMKTTEGGDASKRLSDRQPTGGGEAYVSSYGVKRHPGRAAPAIGCFCNRDACTSLKAARSHHAALMSANDAAIVQGFRKSGDVMMWNV